MVPAGAWALWVSGGRPISWPRCLGANGPGGQVTHEGDPWGPCPPSHLPSSSQLSLPGKGGCLGWPGRAFRAAPGGGRRWALAKELASPPWAQPPGHYPLPSPAKQAQPGQPNPAPTGLLRAFHRLPPGSPFPPGRSPWALAPLSPPRFASDTGGACSIVGHQPQSNWGAWGWKLWGAGAVLGSQGCRRGGSGGWTPRVSRGSSEHVRANGGATRGMARWGQAGQGAAGRSWYSCPATCPRPFSSSAAGGMEGGASAAHHSGGARPQGPQQGPPQPAH